MYVNRVYRDNARGKNLESFHVVYKETDLHIQVDKGSLNSALIKKAEQTVLALRYDLETYIKSDPEFQTALRPHVLLRGAPSIAGNMARAARAADVGPMAAVAGTVAEFVGRELLKNCSEVIIENGGDIFMAAAEDRIVAIFAGQSPFSTKIAVEIPTAMMPVSVCTSSGTVGPSLSYGKADAAVILAKSAALADAAATAAGNSVKTAAEVRKGIQTAQKIKGIIGALIIKDDQMAVWGGCKIVPLLNPRQLDPK